MFIGEVEETGVIEPLIRQKVVEETDRDTREADRTPTDTRTDEPLLPHAA